MRVPAAAGVVDHDVDAAELVRCPLDDRGKCFGIIDIGTDDEGAAAELAAAVGDAVEGSLRPRAQHDVRTHLRVRHGDGFTDPSPRPGDDRGLVLEAEVIEEQGTLPPGVGHHGASPRGVEVKERCLTRQPSGSLTTRSRYRPDEIVPSRCIAMIRLCKTTPSPVSST